MSKTLAASLCLFLSISVISTANAGTHSTRSAAILRSYPIPASVEVPVGTDIGITAAAPFGASGGIMVVVGSISGVHQGTVHYSVDRTTIIFHPSAAFNVNETVTVLLSATLANELPVRDSFSFQTVKFATGSQFAKWENMETASQASQPQLPGKFSKDKPLNGLAPMVDSVYSLAPTPGKVYISIAGGSSSISGLSVLDENGNLLHHTSFSTPVWDFLVQPNGEMTYYHGGGSDTSYSGGLDDGEFYGLDTSFNVVDTFGCANGYMPDVHELIVQKDGGYTILGATLSYADLSSVGGSSNAEIQGNVIQTFDSHRNLVFQWRGIDYYNPTDAQGINFRSSPVDFEHANSIDIDADGNYLLSNRHLSEVTKINGRTGAIMWRFGGHHNQFTSLNDTIGISYQHCARFLPNNHIMLFDNGNLHTVPVSRAVEFAMDTSNMTDSVVWQFHHNPEISTATMGSVQRLPNGNTFIGWGAQLGFGTQTPSEAATEVRPDGTVVSDWTFLSLVFSYRALKYPTPSVTVTAPSKNDSLLAGTRHPIEFLIIDTSGDGSITLQYSTDSMLTWNQIATISNQTSYNWLVPKAPSHTVFVRVIAGGLVGVSQQFSILDSGKINVSSPGINASLLVGTTQSIQFSMSGYIDASLITLQYSTDNKTTWNPIATLSNQTSYDWLIPHTPSAAVFVRVRDANGAVGLSQPFSILDSGRITITAPAKNDSLDVGANYTIQFSATGFVDNNSITLEYSTDGTFTWNPIATLSNQSTYNWLVPNAPSARAIIRAMDDNGVIGLSQLFTILDTATKPGVGRITINSPAANESLLVGTTHAITFAASGPVNEQAISLQYSIDNMRSWNPITTLSGQTSYGWVVPSTPSTTAYVRVADDNGVAAISGMFSIVDSGRVTNVTVTGAPDLPPGVPETIRWNASGLLGETVDVDLFDPISGTYSSIASGFPAATRSYNWASVPTAPASGYFIRVTYASGATGSSAPFNIAASGIIPGGQTPAVSVAPNPFSAISTLRFSIAANADVTLIVRDMLGREVVRLAEGSLSAGSHVIMLDGTKLSPGAYQYQLLAGSSTLSGKLTIVR